MQRSVLTKLSMKVVPTCHQYWSKPYWAFHFVLSAFPHVVGNGLCLSLFWRAAHEAWVLVSTISRFWWTPPCAKNSFFGLGAKTHWCWSESLLCMSESVYARWRPSLSWGGWLAEFSLGWFSLFWLLLPIQLHSINPVSTASCCILVSECLAVCWLGLGQVWPLGLAARPVSGCQLRIFGCLSLLSCFQKMLWVHWCVLAVFWCMWLHAGMMWSAAGWCIPLLALVPWLQFRFLGVGKGKASSGMGQAVIEFWSASQPHAWPWPASVQPQWGGWQRWLTAAQIKITDWLRIFEADKNSKIDWSPMLLVWFAFWRLGGHVTIEVDWYVSLIHSLGWHNFASD